MNSDCTEMRVTAIQLNFNLPLDYYKMKINVMVILHHFIPASMCILAADSLTLFVKHLGIFIYPFVFRVEYTTFKGVIEGLEGHYP